MFSYDLENLERRLSRLEMKRSLWLEESSQYKQDIDEAMAKCTLKRKSSALLQQCSTHQRQTMASSVEETVSWATRLLLKKDYLFRMDFVQRRNQWECDLKLVDPDGLEVDIKHGTGGGVVDVISFSLYILFYTLFAGNSKLPVILDEPLKHVSTEIPEYADRTIAFLRGICERLGVQMIIVTHQEPLVAAADKAFKMQLADNMEVDTTVVSDITATKPVYTE